MLAKILGIVLVIWGAVLAIELIFPVLGGFFAAGVLVAMIALAVGVLYLGTRWLSGERALGKVAGVLAVLVGLAIGAKAVLGAVVGLFGAILLAIKIAVVCAMVYVGWGWFQQGAFRLPRRGGFA